jgi:proton glutamate symport protein
VTNVLKIKLHWQILIALGLAIVAGFLTGTDASIFGVTYYAIYAFFGTLFLNALKMIVVPLVVSSIIVGIAGASGLKTLGYYLTTSLVAILIGLTLVDTISPGVVDGQPAKDIIGLSDQTDASLEKIAGRDVGDIAEVFIRMIPVNVFEAATSNGQLLGLIFFSLLFGFFMTRIHDKYVESMTNFWQGVFEVMMRITDWVIKFAPIGVFALVAKVVATTGLQAFEPLAWFFFTVLGALVIHFAVALPLLLYFIGGVSPLKH